MAIGQMCGHVYTFFTILNTIKFIQWKHVCLGYGNARVPGIQVYTYTNHSKSDNNLEKSVTYLKGIQWNHICLGYGNARVVTIAFYE